MHSLSIFNNILSATHCIELFMISNTLFYSKKVKISQLKTITYMIIHIHYTIICNTHNYMIIIIIIINPRKTIDIYRDTFECH